MSKIWDRPTIPPKALYWLQTSGNNRCTQEESAWPLITACDSWMAHEKVTVVQAQLRISSTLQIFLCSALIMISDSSCSESKSTLQIPDGCSQTTVCKSLRGKKENCFDRVPLFQVYFYGLGTQVWKIDVKLDNGALVSNNWLRNKIRSPIQQAFKETLSDPDYHCFRTWFSQRGNNNRKWMKITDYTEPFPGIPPNFGA